MNANSTFDMNNATSVCPSPIHEFVEQHWPALRNAAELLGGRRSIQEVERLFDDLSRSLTIGIHTQRRIDRLVRLLELDDEVVSVDHRLQCIHPADPIIAELGLLLDGLKHAQAAAIDDRRSA
jgi:phosphoribosylformimino-5-aminoimidazole carboxamide ribonucleotide (ProFAR) isomerase